MTFVILKKVIVDLLVSDIVRREKLCLCSNVTHTYNLSQSTLNYKLVSLILCIFLSNRPPACFIFSDSSFGCILKETKTLKEALAGSQNIEKNMLYIIYTDRTNL